MTEVLKINARGTLTLPKELRKRLGVEEGGQILAEETRDGILLRLGMTLPVEIYSEDRLAEFAKNNEKALEKFRPIRKRMP